MTNDDEPTIVFSKKDSEKYSVTAGELLSALKADTFKDSNKSPVVIHSRNNEDNLHLLKVIYKCGNCNTLHFEGGYVEPNELMLNEHSVIYADYTHDVMAYVSRKVLITVLEKFISNNDANFDIDIRTSNDGGSFPLNEIFKCSKGCQSVHLSTGYIIKK